MHKLEEAHAVSKLRKYLQIKTVHPKPDYATALSFLEDYGISLGLDVTRVAGCSSDYDTIFMTWKGKDSLLPSVLLNSHTDVVPVYEEQWKYDAFAAYKEDNGDIYARGIQDMKSVGIQYLEAIRKLKHEGYRFERDVHVSFVPDEEIGGFKGMQTFMKTPEFSKLNVGIALDEGLATPGNSYTAFYGERSAWWIRVTCKGNPGHGSRFIENTAGEKMRKVLNKFLEYRSRQKSKMESTCVPLGNVTTVNLTTLQGGLAYNIVPAELSASFDFRVPPNVNFEKFEQEIRQWCEEIGEGVTMEFIQKDISAETTATDQSNPWWIAFSTAIKKLGINLNVEVFSGGTDSRFLRRAGYNAIGFSPIRNTPILLHDHNEFLNESVFLEGIDVYCAVIPALANMRENDNFCQVTNSK